MSEKNTFGVVFKEKKEQINISQEEINQYLKKITERTYKKIRNKDDEKVKTILMKFFSNEMRNHHIEFKKQLVARIKRGKSIDSLRKYELYILIDQITLCAPLRNADEIGFLAPQKNTSGHNKKPKPAQNPAEQLKAAVREDDSAIKLRQKGHKGPVGLALGDLLERKELDSDSRAWLSYCIELYVQITLEHLREEILFGYLQHGYFFDFNPPLHASDSDEEYIEHILSFSEQIEEAGRYQVDGEYVNLEFIVHLREANERLNECKDVLNAIMKRISPEDKVVKELSEF